MYLERKASETKILTKKEKIVEERNKIPEQYNHLYV